MIWKAKIMTMTEVATKLPAYYGRGEETTVDGVKYGAELLGPAVGEVFELNKAHWDEVAGAYFKTQFNPDYERLLTLESCNKCVLFTARGDSGELVGIAIFILESGVWAKHQLLAYEQVFYVDPEFRNLGIAHELAGFVVKFFDVMNISATMVSDNSLAGGGELKSKLETQGFSPLGVGYIRVKE